MSEALNATRAPWVARHEGWIVVLAGTLAFLAIPLSLGYLGLSWDAVNHHFYLGWTADQPRFDLDYVPAGFQSYQYPYLYWPVYKLAMAGANGVTAGLVLALIHATAIPAVWLIARSCIPGEDLFATGMRAAGVLLAFINGLVLSMFDTTSNDLMAAIPLLWSYALALRPIAPGSDQPLRWLALSGLLAGFAVAFKVSNGLLVLALPVLWLWAPGPLAQRILRCLAAGIFVAVGFALAYGYWGWQLWVHFGNPLYPFADELFAPLRDIAGWHP